MSLLLFPLYLTFYFTPVFLCSLDIFSTHLIGFLLFLHLFPFFCYFSQLLFPFYPTSLFPFSLFTPPLISYLIALIFVSLFFTFPPFCSFSTFSTLFHLPPFTFLSFVLLPFLLLFLFLLPRLSDAFRSDQQEVVGFQQKNDSDLFRRDCLQYPAPPSSAPLTDPRPAS